MDPMALRKHLFTEGMQQQPSNREEEVTSQGVTSSPQAEEAWSNQHHARRLPCHSPAPMPQALKALSSKVWEAREEWQPQQQATPREGSSASCGYVWIR